MQARREKKKATTLYLVLIALFSALVFVVTFLLPVPIGVVGYVNFGDAMIFISSVILGPVGGAAAGAIGSMTADLLLGYAHYAPFTFVIKGIEGLLCGLLYCYLFKRKNRWFNRIVSMLIAGAWATLGYFIADTILYGVYVGFANSLFMLLQVGLSMLIALIVLPHIPDIYDGFREKLFKKDATVTVKAVEVEKSDDEK